jgi:hypothetical protein
MRPSFRVALAALGSTTAIACSGGGSGALAGAALSSSSADTGIFEHAYAETSDTQVVERLVLGAGHGAFTREETTGRASSMAGACFDFSRHDPETMRASMRSYFIVEDEGGAFLDENGSAFTFTARLSSDGKTLQASPADFGSRTGGRYDFKRVANAVSDSDLAPCEF